jgi:hypothetical protein
MSETQDYEDYEDYEPFDEDLSASAVEAKQLSVDELKLHYAEGELNHLTEAEMLLLLSNAANRDLQKTILH